MTFRQKAKYWLYGRCPGYAGVFPYFGVQVHFPRRSLIFEVVCMQGIYEAANLRVLVSALKPNTTVFDVGANIGLLSIPLLFNEPSLQVVSVEPSLNTLDCLRRTLAGSPFADRWAAEGVALADHEGTVDFFFAAPSLAVYDGIHDTHRAGPTRRVSVTLTTLDRLWIARGRPAVSAIKIDVEGGDAAVLQGAHECLRAHRPLVLIEWNAANLCSHHNADDVLLTLANEFDYIVHAMPSLVRVESPAHLRALMQFDESFVLLPRV